MQMNGCTRNRAAQAIATPGNWITSETKYCARNVLAIAEHGRGPHHPDITYSPGTNGSNVTPSSDESAASLSLPPCDWPNLSKKEWIPLRRPNFPPQYAGLIAIVIVLSK